MITIAQLEDLYVELAAHLMTCPIIREYPPYVEWLGDRVLTGFPDPDGYESYKNMYWRSTFSSECPLAKLMGKFAWCDTSQEDAKQFSRSMHLTCTMLHDYGQPAFPKEKEVHDAHDYFSGRLPIWIKQPPANKII